MNKQVWMGIGMLALATVARGQDVPWDVYEDALSDSVCDVVNAATAELVVLSATGQLVIVGSGGADVNDVTLADTFVDLQGCVFVDNEPFGFISFQEDGDGFRTVFWTSLVGTVVDVDPFTGFPEDTDLFPEDFIDVPCDACDFWDDQSVCEVIIDPTDPPIVISICGAGSTTAFVGMLAGITALRLTRVRRRCA